MISAQTWQLRAFAAQLAGFGAVAEGAATAIVRIGGENAERVARELVPVRTGHLRSEIFLYFDRDGLEFTLGDNADYAEFVEYGTWRMAPQPFINPALDQAAQITVFALQSMIERLL